MTRESCVQSQREGYLPLHSDYHEEERWGVWENGVGVFWSVHSGSKEEAEYEANPQGLDHIAVREVEGRRLSNAFAAGRMEVILKHRSGERVIDGN